MCVRERVQLCVLRGRPAVLLLFLSWCPARLLPLRRLVPVLALLNRQRQPGLNTWLVVSMHREAEIPPALVHPHSVWYRFYRCLFYPFRTDTSS